MAEATSNVEFVQKLQEHEHRKSAPADRQTRLMEILEAIVLAMVAVATAWSSYQASQWDGLSAQYYSLASRATIASQEKMTQAGQDRLYDITTFNGWVAARMAGNNKLAAFYERRFRPEYATVYAIWIKLDPFNNPSVPSSPIFMAEYANANALQSAKLIAEARGHYETGVSARKTGDKYVKVTVLLATILLLTALSQRFVIFAARAALAGVAFVLLVFSTYSIVILPRA